MQVFVRCSAGNQRWRCIQLELITKATLTKDPLPGYEPRLLDITPATQRTRNCLFYLSTATTLVCRCDAKMRPERYNIKICVGDINEYLSSAILNYWILVVVVTVWFISFISRNISRISENSLYCFASKNPCQGIQSLWKYMFFNNTHHAHGAYAGSKTPLSLQLFIC